jgi:hypothetical protein
VGLYFCWSTMFQILMTMLMFLSLSYIRTVTVLALILMSVIRFNDAGSSVEDYYITSSIKKLYS